MCTSTEHCVCVVAVFFLFEVIAVVKSVDQARPAAAALNDCWSVVASGGGGGGAH